MSRPASGKKTDQIFRRTYAPSLALNAFDLSKVSLRDTVIVDDTGGTTDCVLKIPKIGTTYAPVGLRVTIKKPSNVAHAIAITPDGLDAITSGLSVAYPGFGAVGFANSLALPAGAPNAVTIEATDMNIAPGTQPNPVGGRPTTAGAWMVVTGGRGASGNTSNYLFNGTANFINGVVVVPAGLFALTANSVIQITRSGLQATAIGVPEIVARTNGAAGVATFTIRAANPADGTATAADQGQVGFTIIG